MKYSQNVPLSSREMRRLPLGFTPTSYGFTGQEIKRMSRANPDPHTNRKTTPGRILQTILNRDEEGNLTGTARLVCHRSYSRIINQ
jgi:hypothetical protein